MPSIDMTGGGFSFDSMSALDTRRGTGSNQTLVRSCAMGALRPWHIAVLCICVVMAITLAAVVIAWAFNNKRR
jgi:hypothetical protein